MRKKGFVVISALLAIGGIAFMKITRKKDSFEPSYLPEDHPILEEAVNTGNRGKIKKENVLEKGKGLLKKGTDKLVKILEVCRASEDIAVKEMRTHTERQDAETKHEDTCTDELLRDGNNLGGIINKTDAVLRGRVSKNEKINCAGICKFWCEIFDEGSFKKLLEEYNSIAEKCGIASGDISEEAAEELLTKWMEFLEELGIHSYEDKSADENGNVVVTYDNRMFYENGRKFPDGTVCKVIKMPWMFKGDIYYRGTLEKIECGDAPQEQGTDEAKSENVEHTAEEEKPKEIKEDE